MYHRTMEQCGQMSRGTGNFEGECGDMLSCAPPAGVTAYPCLARAGEDIAFRFGCTIDGAGLGFNRRSARRRSVRLRRPWRATHENAGSVAPVDLGIHVFEHHDAAVKGKDFTILHARRAARRADIVLA